MKPESQRLIEICELLIAQKRVRSLATLSDLAFGNKNYFTAMKRQNTNPSPVMINYLVDNFSVNADYIRTGEGPMLRGETAGIDAVQEPIIKREDTIARLAETVDRQSRQIDRLIDMIDKLQGNTTSKNE